MVEDIAVVMPRLVLIARLLPLFLASAVLRLFAGEHALVLLPELREHLVCAYTFDHPAPAEPALELDLGPAGLALPLVNGGAAMRVPGGAYPGSRYALQTRQIEPDLAGQNDWKAGLHRPGGAPELAPFAAARGITLLGWVRPDAERALLPGLRSDTPAPDDRYPAICLFGVLHGSSDGHTVRGLLELLPHAGGFRLIGLARRRDAGPALLLAASDAPETLLPPGRWTHLAAAFDFETGAAALYRDGEPLGTLPPVGTEPPAEPGEPPRRSDASTPTGIKIGGSHPENTRERNPFDGRFDDLLFFNHPLSAGQIRRQYALYDCGPATPEGAPAPLTR